MSTIRERIAQLTQLVESGESTDADEAVLEALLDADREHAKAADRERALARHDAAVRPLSDAVKAARAAGPAGEYGGPNNEFVAYSKTRSGGALDLRATFAKAADAFRGAKGAVVQPITVSDGLSFLRGADALQPVGQPRYGYVHELFTTQLVTSRAYTVWRQAPTVGTAEIVAAGDLKPLVTLGGSAVVDEVHTVAAVAGPIAEQDLSDVDVLASLITDELAHAVALEVDRQCLYGVSPIVGVNNDAGVPLVPFDTDGFTSLRNGIASVELAGYRPTVIVAHPLDVAALDVTKDATYQFLSPGAPHVTPMRQYWGVPVIAHPSATQGVALLGQADQATLVVRENVEIAASREYGDAFRRNQQWVRAEARIGFCVRAAGAFARVELSDGGAGS